jgi:hypothetical protein
MAHGPYEHPEVNWATARIALRMALRATELAFAYDELEYCQRLHPELFAAEAERARARKLHHLRVAASHAATAERCIRALNDHEKKETPDGREDPGDSAGG